MLAGTTPEERDLVDAFGDRYRAYRREVRAFLPRPWRRVSATAALERGDD